MTLQQALNKLPPDMLIKDMLELDKSKRTKTVSQVMAEQQEFLSVKGYVIRIHDSIYGTPGRNAIGQENGPNIYIEADINAQPDD